MITAGLDECSTVEFVACSRHALSARSLQREEDLPAKQQEAQEQARLPQANEQHRRA